MNVSLEARRAVQARADVLIIGRHAGESRLTGELAAVDDRMGGLLARAMAAEKFEGKPGQSCHVHANGRLTAPRVLVVGMGPARGASAETVRRAAASAARRARDLGAASASMYLPAQGVAPKARAQAAVEGAVLGTYRFEKYLKEKNPRALQSVAVLEPDARAASGAREGVQLGGIWAAATATVRDLVNEPANVVNPTYLATQAEAIAKAGRVLVKVLDREDCERLGMGAFVGVAQGSQEPPKFIHLTYAPRRARRKVVVVGKGITFDSGGLDLKTADGMLRMKGDMSGAAVVLGLFQALPKLKLDVEVHGIIAATENMPSGTAQRPGDIVRAMNGLTIEIGNTDAEGRLTLADAMAYAAKEIEPDEIIDLATLTGAIVIALGQGVTGVFGTQDAMTTRLLAAAEAAGEPMWRMPLHDDYKEGLRSDVADLNNISSQRGGGSIVAALFMRDFTGGLPWIHLDIAGTAFSEREWSLGPKGGTGSALRTLLAYLSRVGGKR
jgi:leucyl aminopeptidase